MTTLLVYIFFAIFAMLEGYREAFTFHYKVIAEEYLTTDLERKDLHACFTVLRSIVFIILLALEYNSENLVLTVIIGVSMICAFPYFHDGALYLTRHKLNNKAYIDGWDSDPSSTTSAKINFTTNMRLILFLISVGLLLYILFIIPVIN